MTEEERNFHAMMERMKEWPVTPPAHLSQESRLMYLAAKEVLTSQHVLAAQRHMYCTHSMAFVLRPIFDTIFNMIQNEVERR